MEKNEHAIFQDIPLGGRNGKYHSAILTTYAVDLIHFDNQLLNILHRKQICSINVFADAKQLDKSIECASPIYMKNIGKEYCISRMNAMGAFHPKINVFVGDEAVLVVLGTGNLTVCGHGKNHEAFTGFMIDESNLSHRPLIEECWKYLTQFTRQCGKYEVNRILHEIPDNCLYLDSNYEVIPHSYCYIQDGLDAALLYNEQQNSILKQISNSIPLNEIEKITILSPYFDQDGATLTALSDICPQAKISVLLQENHLLSTYALPKSKRISYYDFNETKRGKQTFNAFDRQLHAKIFHFKSKDYEYCLIGSANATTAGLGTLNHRGANEEFCVLYRSNHLDFLSILGLKTNKRIDIKTASQHSVFYHIPEVKHQYVIHSAQYELSKLTIRCNKVISNGLYLAIDNGNYIQKEELQSDKDSCYSVSTRLSKGQYLCYLVNEGNTPISNKLYINWNEILETTNPSKTSRSINRFIAHIENEGYDGMDIANILSDVMWDLANDTEEEKQFKLHQSSFTPDIKGQQLPELQYNPSYDNDNPKSSRVITIDRTSRLIECIEESIRNKIKQIGNAIIDEEETGSAETSNDRDIEENKIINIEKNKINDFSNLSNSVLERYQKMINKRIEQVQYTKDYTITKDDLNFFSLSIFAAMEICYLNRSYYQFDTNDSMSKSMLQKKLYDSLDRSMSHRCIETFEKFVNFCTILKLPKSIDENFLKVARRSMKYGILFSTLFYKFSTQENITFNGARVIKNISKLLSIFEVPSLEYLSEELEPLSERYNYVFRINHIESMIKKIND